MLSISPQFTANLNGRPAFKGLGEGVDYESLSKDKVDFYKQQTQELEDMANDTLTPKPAKKLLHGAAVISAALLEGWAVFWGASKLSKVAKIGLMSFKDGKIYAKVKNMFKNTGKIKSAVSSVVNFAKNNVNKLRNSNFAKTKTGDIVVKVVNALIKAGKAVGKGLKYVGKGLKAVGKFIYKPVEKHGAEKVYDTVTKGVATTLGVGSGVAGAYSASIKDKEQLENLSEVA